MRILLDESTPRRIKGWFVGDEVRTVVEMSWGGVKNGRLLRLASDSFEVFVTADKALEHQQNLTGLKVGIVVLPTNHWRSLQPYQTKVLTAVRKVGAGRVLAIAS